LKTHRILILIPVWKRPEITELCFSGLDRLRKHRPDLTVLTIISEEDYEARCKAHNIAYTFFENSPLGRKKNHGLNEALKLEWDYLIEINSDDLIKNELLDIYDTMEDHYLALRNFCFLDSVTLGCRQFESKTAYGIGRRYSREAVLSCRMIEAEVLQTCMSESGILVAGQKADIYPEHAEDLERAKYIKITGESYKMWKDEATAGMDNHSNARRENRGYQCKQVFTDEPLAVDIKSGINIWAYNPDVGFEYNIEDLKKGLPELDGLIASHKTNIHAGTTR
jgi:hypothetical protein